MLTIYFTGYYRLGNTCAKCQNFPYSVVSFGFFLLFAIIATVINGFSESVCTKVSSYKLTLYWNIPCIQYNEIFDNYMEGLGSATIK